MHVVLNKFQNMSRNVSKYFGQRLGNGENRAEWPVANILQENESTSDRKYVVC